jgi:hypothetical protein
VERIEPTISEAKGACSDDCATEATLDWIAHDFFSVLSASQPSVENYDIKFKIKPRLAITQLSILIMKRTVRIQPCHSTYDFNFVIREDTKV